LAGHDVGQDGRDGRFYEDERGGGAGTDGAEPRPNRAYPSPIGMVARYPVTSSPRPLASSVGPVKTRVGRRTKAATANMAPMGARESVPLRTIREAATESAASQAATPAFAMDLGWSA
jgi:hypothetical protein